MINFEKKIASRIELLRHLHHRVNLQAISDILASSLTQGNKILVFGNGGSATQSSHFAAELVNRFLLERSGMPAIALSADVANLTSIANDRDFKYIFSRQLEALGREGDVAFGLTTSGKSENILEAFRTAARMNLKSVCLCGNDTESLEPLDLDGVLAVPSGSTPEVQEIHLLLIHLLAENLEINFAEAGPSLQVKDQNGY